MSELEAEIASLRAQLADAIRQRDSYHQGLFQVHALLADRTAQFTRPQLGEMCRAALAAGEHTRLRASESEVERLAGELDDLRTLLDRLADSAEQFARAGDGDPAGLLAEVAVARDALAGR